MLGKNKLNIIKVLIYKHLTDSYMKKALKILRQKIIMFDITKDILISKEEFTNTDYERLKKGIELSRKQFERFW